MSRRRALVTGAARRVGRATALELAGCGFDVAVHHRRSEDDAEALVAACRAEGSDAWRVRADLATVAGCRTLSDAVLARWDRVDLVVHNASAFHAVPFEDIDVEAWDRMMAVNLRAPFLVSQALVPALRASGSGLVVHLCDIGAERPMPGHAHYAVSKAGLVMLVKAMAIELAPAIRTVGISPGHVAWPEAWSEETCAAMRARIPMGRVGEPEDVARLVRFVATEAPYVNGAVIAVDGGLAAAY